jgi:hypothetical protein
MTDLCPADEAADDGVLLQAGGIAAALPELAKPAAGNAVPDVSRWAGGTLPAMSVPEAVDADQRGASSRRCDRRRASNGLLGRECQA